MTTPKSPQLTPAASSKTSPTFLLYNCIREARMRGIQLSDVFNRSKVDLENAGISLKDVEERVSSNYLVLNADTGLTALMYAASRGDEDFARFLLNEDKTALDARDVLFNTALIYAASAGHKQLAALFISNGAKFQHALNWAKEHHNEIALNILNTFSAEMNEKHRAVIAIDGDGCFLEPTSVYDAKSKINKIQIIYSPTITQFCLQMLQKGIRIDLMDGSLRQSLSLEKLNDSKLGGGCFAQGLEILEKYLQDEAEALKKQTAKQFQVNLDRYLLTDAKNDGSELKAFQYILNHFARIDDYQKALDYADGDLTDPGKLILMYAQMHRQAYATPEETIRYYFIDDCDEILKGAEKFFGKNPWAIPKNVELILQSFDPVTIHNTKLPRVITTIARISGTGEINKKYNLAVINKKIPGPLKPKSKVAAEYKAYSPTFLSGRIVPPATAAAAAPEGQRPFEVAMRLV